MSSYVLFEACDTCLNMLNGFEDYAFLMGALQCLDLLPHFLNRSSEHDSLHRDIRRFHSMRRVMSLL
jgi:hypothetical protein